ncbi:MAG: hypothetical protein CVV42_04475 [Candidatus Riflebacteria bacterium HGW-Riflebacteria-2]|jgi:hypothetical protein|nr:MAG: hypothetical protein CVV42_04475 [Candidatus Riflebacteria bacterium HGW-Riflebacteria-2]
MKHLIIIILSLMLSGAVSLSACTMEPSIWQTVEAIDSEDDPGVFALSDALYQLREKLTKELSACNMPVQPLTFVGIFYGDTPTEMSSSTRQILEQATEIVWNDARILPPAELVRSPQDFVALQKAAEAAGKESYTALLQISGARSSSISQIDLNFWLYQLYRCVLREEIKVLLRVADSEGTAIFIDEIAVSPTIIVDPMLSPVGGYIIRLEKNTASPLMVDFGPLEDGGEHVLRFNDAFRQPSPTPPMKEFQQIQRSGDSRNAADN